MDYIEGKEMVQGLSQRTGNVPEGIDHPFKRKVPIAVENKRLNLFLVDLPVYVQIQPATMTDVLGNSISRIGSAQCLFFSSRPNAQFELALIEMQRTKGLLACAETGRAKLLILARFR